MYLTLKEKRLSPKANKTHVFVDSHELNWGYKRFFLFAKVPL